MSKKLCLLGLFVLGMYRSIRSQSAISGRVIDQQGAAVDFANILLLNSKDSSLIKGELSDENGQWTMQIPFTGTFILRERCWDIAITITRHLPSGKLKKPCSCRKRGCNPVPFSLRL